MKKRIALFFVLCAFLAAAFGLAACAGSTDTYTYHTVTYRLEEGSAEIQEISVKDGETAYKLFEPFKDGHDFVAWTLDGEPYDFDAPVTSDIELVGTWTAGTGVSTEYSVVFKRGETVIASYGAASDEKVYAPAIALQSGERFVDWYDEANEVSFVSGEPVTADRAFVLRIEYRVSFYNYDGALVGETYAAPGERAVFDGAEPAHLYPDFYLFSGWNYYDPITEPRGITAQYVSRTLPEEIFDFTLLDDGTYGIALKPTDDPAAAEYYTYQFEGNYVLPSKYNGQPVTRVLHRGFYAPYDSVRNVYATVFNDYLIYCNILVPDSYRVIEGEAFAGLIGGGEDGLGTGSIVISEGVEEIWAHAFLDVMGFNVYLPSTLNYIEYFALEETFAEFFLTPGEVYESDWMGIFQKNYNDEGVFDSYTLVYVTNSTQVEHFVIPPYVTAIYPGLMQNYVVPSRLRTVTFTGSIDTVPAAAFAGSGVTKVNWKGIRRIEGAENYYGHDQSPDSKFHLKADVTIKVRGAFEGNAQMSYHEYDGYQPEGIEYIGDFAFFGSTRLLPEINITSTLEHIGIGAFTTPGYNNLENIIINTANNTKYVADEDNAALIEIGGASDGGDRYIMFASQAMRLQDGNILQQETDYIRDYTVPTGVTEFDSYAFDAAHNLETLTVPEGVEELPAKWLDSNGVTQRMEGSEIVLDYYGLKTLNLPASLKTINGIFPRYRDPDTGLMTQFWGSKIIQAESIALEPAPNPAINTPRLTALNFDPESALSILHQQSIVVLLTGEQSQSPRLTVTLPDNLVNIAPNAIIGAKDYEIDESNENYATFGGMIYEKLPNNELSLHTVKDNNVAADDQDKKFIFPATPDYTLTAIGDNASWRGRHGASEIVIPDGVKTVGAKAFYEGAVLSKVTIPASMKFIGGLAFGKVSSDLQVVFLGEDCPELGFAATASTEGFGAFDRFDDFMGSENLGFPSGGSITVPTAAFDDYYDMFGAYNGAAVGRSYVMRMDISAAAKTYKVVFDPMGGTAVGWSAGEIIDGKIEISGAYALYDVPALLWEGEGTRYLQGWYIQDGTGDVWGEKIDDLVYPYYKLSGDADTVTFYARWSGARLESGRSPWNAYVLNGETLTDVTLNGFGVYFSFTPTENGVYTIGYGGDASLNLQYASYAYADIDGDGLLSNSRPVYGGGWHMRAGTEYILYFEFYVDGEPLTGGEFPFAMLSYIDVEYDGLLDPGHYITVEKDAHIEAVTIGGAGISTVTYGAEPVFYEGGTAPATIMVYAEAGYNAVVKINGVTVEPASSYTEIATFKRVFTFGEVYIDGDATVEITTTEVRHTLTVTESGDNITGVTVDSEAYTDPLQYLEGTAVTVVVTVAEGFKSVVKNGDDVLEPVGGQQNTYEVIISGAVNLTVTTEEVEAINPLLLAIEGVWVGEYEAQFVGKSALVVTIKDGMVHIDDGSGFNIGLATIVSTEGNSIVVSFVGNDWTFVYNAVNQTMAVETNGDMDNTVLENLLDVMEGEWTYTGSSPFGSSLTVTLTVTNRNMHLSIVTFGPTEDDMSIVSMEGTKIVTDFMGAEYTFTYDFKNDTVEASIPDGVVGDVTLNKSVTA